MNDQIDAFVKYADEQSQRYWDMSGYTFAPAPRHRADILSNKWCRVVNIEERNGKWEDASVHSFICLQDGHTKALGNLKAGDIHKPASFKVPAKHARGSVFAPNFGGCVSGNHIKYL